MKTHLGHAWLVLGFLASTVSCGGQAETEIGSVSTSPQALAYQVQEGAQDYVVAFRETATGALLCTGIRLTNDVLLTSANCGAQVKDAADLFVGLFTAGQPSTFTYESAPNAVVLISGHNALVHAPGLSTGGEFTGNYGTIGHAQASGVSATDVAPFIPLGEPALSDTIPVTLGDAGWGCATFGTIASFVDEGAPMLNTSGVAGLVANVGSPLGCTGATGANANVIPGERLPIEIGTGTLGSSPYTYVLGGSGPVLELALFLNGGVFVADTGIPRAFAGTHTGAGINVVTSSTTSVTVTAGSPLPGTVDPSVPGGQIDFGTTVELRTDMGTSFVLEQGDVLSGTSVLDSWKGMPSAFHHDGRFLLLGGTGFGTAHTKQYEAVLDCRGVDTPLIQVYDADTDATLDANDDTGQTCIDLANFGSGNVEGIVLGSNTEEEPQVAADDDVFDDQEWHNVNVGMADGGGGWFHLIVYMTPKGVGQCSFGNATAVQDVVNQFKVRTNCELRNRGSFSIATVDATGGAFVASTQVTTPIETDYDQAGTFAYVVNTEGLGSGFNFINVDADDCDLSCSASGQGHGIHFLALNQFGEVNVSRTGWSTGDSLSLQNPSGSFDGDIATAGDEGLFSVASGNADSVAILWRNVRTNNAVGLLEHSGNSPIVYPAMSNTSTWRSNIVANSEGEWLAKANEVAPLLPITVGQPGALNTATTVQEAVVLLSGDPLLAKLTAAELNRKQTQSSTGLKAETGSIKGTETLVADLLAEARAELASGLPPSAMVLSELDALNQGLVILEDGAPDFAPLENDDGDAFLNGEDNCPNVPNDDQANSHTRDSFGDACDPIPVVDCVAQRGPGLYTAYFGYENPLLQRRLEGDLNRFEPGPAERGQPHVQRVGAHTRVFSVDFDGSPLEWHLAGNTATASSTSNPCGGAELTDVAVNDRVALLASNSIVADDRLNMINFGAMAAGTGGIALGHDAVVADVSTEGDVQTYDHVAVNGTIEANGSVSLGFQSTVDGLTISPATVEVDDIGLVVTPPSTVVTLNPVPSDGALILPPGDYGTLVVGDRATVTLTGGAGEYTFEDFFLNNDAQLILDDDGGLVSVTVSGSLSYGDGASVVSLSGGHPQLLLVYLGAQSARLKASFFGSVIAPNATLELVRGTFGGTFFAENLVLGNDVKVAYHALD